MKKILALLFITFTVAAHAQDNITLTVDKDIIKKGNYNLVIAPQKSIKAAPPSAESFPGENILERFATISASLFLISAVIFILIQAFCTKEIFEKPKKGDMSWYPYVTASAFFALTVTLGLIIVILDLAVYTLDTFALIAA